MNMFYTLDDNNNVVPCELTEWSKLYEETYGRQRRRVDSIDIDDKHISTVFLGLDHNYFGGKPLLFETMIFDAEGSDIYCERYSTWIEAEEGHKKAIQWVKDGCKDENME
jgi:hypothetical protein